MPVVDSTAATEAVVVPAKTFRSKLLRENGVARNESLLPSSSELIIICRVLIGLCFMVLTVKLVVVSSSSTNRAIARISRRVVVPRPRFILVKLQVIMVVMGAVEVSADCK